MKKNKPSQNTHSKEGGLTKIALRRFRKNIWGMISFGFLVICVLIAIFSYALVPDQSKNANQMHLSIHSKEPGFTVTILTLPEKKEAQNSFDIFFFGRKTTTTEIPISNFE